MAYDIKVQRGYTDIGNAGGTATLGSSVLSTSSAFAINTNNRRMHGGRADLDTGNLEVDDMSGGLYLSDTSTLQFDRISTSADFDMRFSWEVWEYVGDSGGNNEFIVRGTYQLTLNAAESITQAVSNISNIDDCVPYITGILSDETVDGADTATAIAWMSGTGTLNVKRGSGSNNTVQVYVTVVEYTGSNWSVKHGRQEGSGTDSGTVTLVDDADGTTSGGGDVSNWDNALIIHQYKANALDGVDDALADTSAVLYPGSSTTEVDWLFNADHVDSASAGSREEFMVHVLCHSGMSVNRYTDTQSLTGVMNVSITSGDLTDLSVSAVEVTRITSGTGTAYGRGWVNARITSTTNVELWVHRSGNTIETRIQVVDLSGVLAPEYSINGYRIRKDDGSETAANWYAPLNTEWTPAANTNFRVRFLLKNVSVSNYTNHSFKLQASVNSGTWYDVTTSTSNVKIVNSTYLTDGADCTQQIGSGTFLSDNNGVCDVDGTTGQLSLPTNQEAEFEYSLQISTNSCPFLIELRLVEVNDTAMSYNYYPFFGGSGFASIPTAFDTLETNTLERGTIGTATVGVKDNGNICILDNARSMQTDTTTGDNGVQFNFNSTPSAVDMTDELFVISVAYNAPNRIQLETKANHGFMFWLHTDSTNYRYWQVGGGDTDISRYPGHRVWVIDPISTQDMTEVGTFDKTSILYYGRTVRYKQLSASTLTHLSFWGQATRIGTSKTSTNIPKVYGFCSSFESLYKAVAGNDFTEVKHNYVKKIGDNYLFYCPFVIGKTDKQTRFNDKGATIVSPGQQDDPVTKLSNYSMRVYFDLQTDDEVILSGTYQWGTPAEWDMNTSETITLNDTTFMGMGDITMGSGIDGYASFYDVGIVKFNTSGNLDGSTFSSPSSTHLLEI